MKFNYLDQALSHAPTLGFVASTPQSFGTYTCLVQWEEGCSIDGYDFEVLELVYNDMTKTWCIPETMLESIDFRVLGYSLEASK